jgi:prepilin-type N-terminal cleavage/methylation domain-containing protein
MRRSIHRRGWSAGLTLVEMMATIVVLGVMLVGLSLGVRTILQHYRHDTVYQELRQYGHLVMREIMREISLAQFISKDDFNGFTRLHLSRFDSTGQLTSVIISGDEQDGILFDSRLPLEGQAPFPTTGRFRQNLEIRLEKFTARKIQQNRPDLARFANSTWEIELVIAVETLLGGRSNRTEEIRFHRLVFMPNKYLNLRSSQGGATT